MSGPRALVVDDGVAATGVAAVRGLARAGFAVALAGPPGLAAASRRLATRHVGPSVRDDPDGWWRTVLAGAARADVVVPTGDAELLALAERAADLPAPLLAPDVAVVRRVADKAWLSATGPRHGLPAPRGWVVAADGGGLPAGALPPGAAVVVKPVVHSPDAPAVAARRATWAEVLAAPPPGALVQEAVEGPLGSLVVALGPDGALLGSVQQEATVVHPAGAGNTVRGRTVPTDPRLLDAVLALLRAVGWWGPMQVETVGGCVVDLNGRAYGSLGLAQAAGVDPVALAALARIGRPPATPVTGAVGVRWSSLGLDLRAAAALPQHRGTAVRAALAASSGAAHALWDARDPGPARVALGRTARAARRRALGRRG